MTTKVWLKTLGEKNSWNNFYTYLTLKYGEKKARQLEKLQSKTKNKMCSVIFNKTRLSNNLQLNYTIFSLSLSLLVV